MRGSNEKMRVVGTGAGGMAPPISDEVEPSWESTVRKDILVGKQIGEYVVRRRIGSGGMGVVYEGEHPVIGRKVAIKIIRPDSDAGLLSRDLASEARATSGIRHRGIIDIFGFGTLPGVGQYLIMEYLKGRPLDEVLQERAPMPVSEAIRLITEVLGALSAAHGAGVIHRDLKPGNIFVVLESNGAEYVKVLDFGLAKQAAAPNAATPQTRASLIVGTPEYMAPEQACGQAVSPRTDLYAVGIILFEMLTGRLPFQGASPMHVAMQQVQAQRRTPSSFVEGLPSEMDDLVLRLLAKEPEQRPVSAEAVARELKVLSRTLAAEMTQLSGLTRPSSPALSAVHAPASGVAPTFVSARDSAKGAGPARAERSESPHTARLPEAGRMPAAPRARFGVKQGLVGVIALVLCGGSGLVTLKAMRPAPAPAVTAPVPPPPRPAVPVVAVTPPPQVVEGVASPAPVPPEEPVTPEETPRSPALSMGSLQLLSRCWSYVYIDGVLRGRAPMQSISLPAGPHSLELKRNPQIEEHRTRIMIRPGQQLELRAPCRTKG